MKISAPKIWALVIAALVLGVGAAFIRLGSRERVLAERAEREQRAAATAQSLHQHLEAAIVAVAPAAAQLLVLDPARSPVLPAGLSTSPPIVGWLAIRDGGGLESVGAQLSAEGLEQLTGPARLNSAAAAAATRPQRTVDGQWVLVVPVAASPLSRPVREADSVRIAAVLSIDSLLAATELRQLPLQGFDYELSSTDSVTGQRQLLARSSEFRLLGPVSETVRVAGEEWTLAVSPRRPPLVWGRTDQWVTAVVVLLLTLSAGLVTHDITSRVGHLRDEVQTHRQRLAQVDQRLMDEIQQRADIEQQFAHANFHDAVTGLANRRYFASRVNRSLYRLRREPGASIAVLVIGFDRFKSVNDTFGYGAGDALLHQAARRIEECTQPADIALARIGGDEFAVLLQDLPNVDAALTLAECLQNALAKPFDIESESIFATASVGITVRSSGYAEADDVIREADIALSTAKTQGRARRNLFDASAREAVVTLQQLETDLRLAVERDQLRLHFQPIVSLETGRIAGLETLVRWDHPRQGMVAPAHFIRAAESLGLIGLINRWVLRHAAEQAREWRTILPEDTDFYVSANLSGYDLKESDLCDFVEGLIRETGLPRGVLRLEVTETVLIEDVKGATDLVSGLQRIGVPLLLDDFGTGYSSLSYLDRFHVDYLKIDRSFIQRLAPAGPDSRILKAIVHLAQDLGIATIAEGVETAAEVTILRELGCEYAQGYYFSKPVPADRALELLAAGQFPLPDRTSIHPPVGWLTRAAKTYLEEPSR